ncbi:hypothetical protein ACOME3_002815 [Neoechinorhynchus agilis]
MIDKGKTTKTLVVHLSRLPDFIEREGASLVDSSVIDRLYTAYKKIKETCQIPSSFEFYEFRNELCSLQHFKGFDYHKCLAIRDYLISDKELGKTNLFGSYTNPLLKDWIRICNDLKSTNGHLIYETQKLNSLYYNDLKKARNDMKRLQCALEKCVKLKNGSTIALNRSIEAFRKKASRLGIEGVDIIEEIAGLHSERLVLCDRYYNALRQNDQLKSCFKHEWVYSARFLSLLISKKSEI